MTDPRALANPGRLADPCLARADAAADVARAVLELARDPRPEVYLRCAGALGLAPAAVMMVAAHNGDLVAAAGCGLQTAFVARPSSNVKS